MQEIQYRYQGFPHGAFGDARKGDVWTLVIHELKYPLEVRQKPPRIRLLEDSHVGFVRCELLDPWPGAPEYWPPETAPGAKPPVLSTTPVPAPPAQRRRRTQRAQEVPATTDHGGEAT